MFVPISSGKSNCPRVFLVLKKNETVRIRAVEELKTDIDELVLVHLVSRNKRLVCNFFGGVLTCLTPQVLKF